MPKLIDLIQAGRKVERHHPWPRAVVDDDVWRSAASALADGGLSLLGLWGEASCVHMAILDDHTSDIGVISLDCPDRQFPSVAACHPPALRLERTLHDLFGLQATPETNTGASRLIVAVCELLPRVAVTGAL